MDAARLVQKDGEGGGIWGAEFWNFMGTSTEAGGVQEVQDNKADYTRARTAESYVFRCEEVRGKAISQVPLKAWQTGRDGKRKEIEHDALGVLKETNPIGYVDGTALLRYTLTTIDLHGRCAWQLAFNRKKQPAEIYWQIPTQIEPLPDPKKFFWGIRVTDENGVREIPAAEICYFATDNMANPLKGTSKISVLRNAINLRQYSARSNIDMFKNSMRPDWLLSGNWANSEENMNRLRREVRRHLSGANNRAPLFLGEGATAHLLTMSHQDMEWLEQQRLSQEEISAVFGVPLIYMNNLDRATYENIKTAKLILWHDTMIPEGDVYAELLNKRFLWRFWPETKDKKISLGFDYDEIEGLGEDLALIWERVINMSRQISEQVKNNELTPNQARLIRNQLFSDLGVDVAAFQGDIPGGDNFYRPFQEIPVDQLDLQAVMNVWAMRGQNPEFVESVPGAETAGQNSDDVLDRMAENKPQPGMGQPGQPAQPAQQAQPAAQAQQAQPAKSAPVTIKGPHPLPVRNHRLGPVQKRLTNRLKTHFQGLKNQAERKLRGPAKFLTPTRMVTYKDDFVDPDQDLYDWRQAQDDLAEMVSEGIIDSAAAAYLAASDDYGLKVAWNQGNPWLDKYMGMRLPLVKGIDDNLRARLRASLTDAASRGKSMADIASDVREIFQGAIDDRAEMIARTETIQAYGSASLAAYSDAGVQMAQMYDGDNDDSANCADVNGQIVTLSEAEALMAQEHPNGTRGVAPIIDQGLIAASAMMVVRPDGGRDPAKAVSAPILHRAVLKEAVYTTGRRDAAHDHSTEAGELPVVVFDLHGTLTPSDGFTAPGMPGSMLPPFPGVREGMDLLVAGGCCLHLCTAALSPYHIPDVLTARRALIDGYITAYGLPISFVSGKVGAHVYYDDRMVPVVAGDWSAVMKRVLQKLGKRFDMGSDGIWRRKDIPDTGQAFEMPDPASIPADQPRGLSVPVLDVDLHRCLLQASSSRLQGPGLKPGALDALRQLYPRFTVNLSCAGWDPATHTPEESAQRLAGLRQQVRQLGVPYDEMVSKDHADVAVDDKGVEHTTWAADLPLILQKLMTPHPEDEVTQREPETAVP